LPFLSTVNNNCDGKDGKSGASQDTCLNGIDNAFAEKAMSVGSLCLL